LISELAASFLFLRLFAQLRLGWVQAGDTQPVAGKLGIP
jgi:hypothetical protein